MPKEKFREDIEKKIGRPATATEFATQEFIEKLQEIYAPEFIELCKVVEDSGIILFK